MSPVDRPVRARTRPGRLAAIDRYLNRFESALLRDESTVVDFGFGETPVTTLEWANLLPGTVKIIAIEGDARRAAAAQRAGHERIRFLHGGFETLTTIGPTHVVRAMNVLRGYQPDEISEAHQALGAGLVEGGLLVEGSTDTEGDVTTAHLLRKRDGTLLREAMFFATRFEQGFGPWRFRDCLPRDLRRNVTPGSAIFELLHRWHQAFLATDGELADRFERSTQAIAELSMCERGAVRWAPLGGIEPSTRHV